MDSRIPWNNLALSSLDFPSATYIRDIEVSHPEKLMGTDTKRASKSLLSPAQGSGKRQPRKAENDNCSTPVKENCGPTPAKVEWGA